MSWQKSFATAALLSAPCCVGQTTPNTANDKSATQKLDFSIAVESSTHPLRLDSPMTVTLTVTNISGKDISWEWLRGHQNAAFLAFQFLLMKEGHEAETTFFHRVVSGRQRPDDPPEVVSGSFFPVTYPPGKMFTIAIDLKRLYEIKEPVTTRWTSVVTMNGIRPQFAPILWL
jgi:hypothetical protein